MAKSRSRGSFGTPLEIKYFWERSTSELPVPGEKWNLASSKKIDLAVLLSPTPRDVVLPTLPNYEEPVYDPNLTIERARRKKNMYLRMNS